MWTENGNTYTEKNDDVNIDNNRILQGVFKTKEQAELAFNKQKAIVACWKWAQENAPFEPDWSIKNQNKYLVFYKGIIAMTKDIKCNGKTPEESMVNLWLELNKK